jgi:hypothetical protein
MNSTQLENGTAASLDGGAPQYTNTNGGAFVEAMCQDMVGPSGEEIISYVMQYTDTACAASIYTNMQSAYTPWDSIPAYSKSVAFGYYPLSGNVYAHLGNFFFWMELNSFSNQTVAFQAASQFLTLYKSDMGNP